MNGAECRRLSGGFTCNPCPLNVTGARCEIGTWTAACRRVYHRAISAASPIPVP